MWHQVIYNKRVFFNRSFNGNSRQFVSFYKTNRNKSIFSFRIKTWNFFPTIYFKAYRRPI